MKYFYFISYTGIDIFSATNMNGARYWSCELERNSPITSTKDILEITRTIEKKCNLKSLIIINYILLRKENLKSKKLTRPASLLAMPRQGRRRRVKI